MVQPPSASVFMAFSGAPMPIAIAQKLEQLNYVQAVAPVLVQFNSVNGLDIVYGIDKDRFRAVSGGFTFLSGHDLEGPHDILVDDIYAKGRKLKVGQTLHILGKRLPCGRHRWRTWKGRVIARAALALQEKSAERKTKHPFFS